MKAYIGHSIKPTDAYLVYDLSNLLTHQGYQVEHWYEHQGAQYAYDQIVESQLFIGLASGKGNLRTLVQLFQYANRIQVPAMFLAERSVALPPGMKGAKGLTLFRQFASENPIRFVEMCF